MKKLAIGIMSGTSLDGIDVVVARIEGSFLNTRFNFVAYETIPYADETKNKIRRAMDPIKCNPKLICSLNFELSEIYANAIFSVCENNNISPEEIDYIACHGQTIYHIGAGDPFSTPSSLQLGDGSVLANLCHTTVVSNFRSADIAVGGQGAPLVPYADYVLFREEKVSKSMHNIGGISNLTVIPAGSKLEEIIAFDTGPGNMMIDAFAEILFKVPYDDSGKLARQGTLNQKLLTELMNHPYLKVLPPKSTGREEFGIDFSKHILSQYHRLSPYDLICTITHFTAKSIAKAYKDFVFNKYQMDEIIFSGGGARNKFLMELIKTYLPKQNIKTLSEEGIDDSAKEALAFLILGNETLNKAPSNVPSATGATKRVILGQVSYVTD